MSKVTILFGGKAYTLDPSEFDRHRLFRIIQEAKAQNIKLYRKQLGLPPLSDTKKPKS